MKQLTTVEKYYQFLVSLSRKKKIDFTKEYNKWKLCRTTGAVLKELSLVKNNKWMGSVPTLKMAENILLQLRIRKRGKKKPLQTEIKFNTDQPKPILVVKKEKLTEKECVEYLKAIGKYKIYKITTEEI